MCRSGKKFSLLHDWTEWSNFEIQLIEPMRGRPDELGDVLRNVEWPTITVTQYWQRRRCTTCGHEAVRRVQ